MPIIIQLSRQGKNHKTVISDQNVSKKVKVTAPQDPPQHHDGRRRYVEKQDTSVDEDTHVAAFRSPGLLDLFFSRSGSCWR